MDDLLPKLLSFPPHPPSPKPLSDHQYDEAIKDQIAEVMKIPDTKLLQKTAGDEHVLDVIDPSLHTVPYTFVLLANIKALNNDVKGVDVSTIWTKLTTFMGQFDGRQMRYMEEQLLCLVESMESMAKNNRSGHLVTAPMANAILRLDPSGTMFTPMHSKLVKYASHYRNFNDALPVLEKPILYFPGSSTQPKPRYLCDISLSPATYLAQFMKTAYRTRYIGVLEYFYYCGHCFVGLRNWDMAMQSYESVITYPVRGESVSRVMAEAYKKWVLCSLLLEGKHVGIPKSTSTSTVKILHILAKPYDSLAQIFEGGTASRLKSEFETGHSIWRRDGNMGLAMEVVKAFQKFQIRGLGSVYSKMSFPEIVSHTTSAETGAKVSVQAATDLIQDMINHGEVHATISQPTSGPPILTFFPNAAILSERQIQIELAASTARIQSLTKGVKQTDKFLTQNSEYVKFCKNKKKNEKPGQQATLLGDNAASCSEDVEDEDIMGSED